MPVRGIKVSKGQLKALWEAVGGTDLREVTIKPYDLEGKHGLIATYTDGDQRDEVQVKILVIGDGVVKL